MNQTPSIWNGPVATCFGFHPKGKSSYAGEEESALPRALINTAVVASWLPVASWATGAQKFVVARGVLKEANRDGEAKEMKRLAWTLIARGVAEMLCLGPILFIIDIIVTIGRILKPFKNEAPERNNSNPFNERGIVRARAQGGPSYVTLG